MKIMGRQTRSAMLTLCIVLLRFVLPVCGEECRQGSYGGRCEHLCPERCASLANVNHCDKHSGSCSLGCMAGWYGDQCNSQCSTHCVNRTCSQQEGHCTQGCPLNRKGHFCQTLKVKVPEAPSTGSSTTTESPSPGQAVIAIPVCIIVVAGVIITVIILILRKRRSKRFTHSRMPPEEGMHLIGGNTNLHYASLVGDVDIIKQILSDNSEDVNSRGEDGRTPVMCAASKGHGHVVNLLVDKGADLSLVDNKGENILHVACLGGYMDVVKYLLLQNIVDIKSRGCYGRTPLMKTAEKGHREVLDFLVIKGGNLSSVDDEGNNILHVACIGGHVEMVKHVLSLGIVGINSRGQYGRTPAMMAACCRHKDVVEFLMKRRADVSLVDDDGNTILHVACIGGDLEVVKFVLSLNAVDLNCKGHHQRTPVRMVDFWKHRNVFDFLVSKGADLSQVDDKGENILHVACLEGHLDLVKDSVTNHRVDINSRGRYGRTPVMKAAEKGHKEVLDLLKSNGCDVNLKDDNGNNILHVACIGGHVEIVKFVLSQGLVGINSRGQYGRTPAMMAAGGQHIEVVEVLFDTGADLSLTDNDSNNILHVACFGGRVDVVTYVLSLNVVDINSKGQLQRTPVRMVDVRKHRLVFDLLVSKGADLSQVDGRGENILHVTCLDGHLDLVKDIVTNHRVDINSRGRYGRTPVLKAAEKGHKEVFDLLKSNGGDVAVKDDNGNNILHVACIGGHVEMVKNVVSHKMADINSRGQYGRTPVMMAAGAGHREVLEFLESQGADLLQVDFDNNNILQVACYGGHVEMVKYVLSQNIVNALA
ncbi:serine/threonine-protein phosphatase 6 regulatory ankyrin repeat subunit C-like [Haliotis cracherodii]|uniref:serine/threonine-protein phosphatase 6 regulatory ankyrin repeat subunit C-like n=1 Tax=Haliotis cracherodii TaxID=6455 RepID=UPI0039EC6ECF